MSEELESPVEKLSEDLHEAAHHSREGWLKFSALMSGIFAVLAAISGLQSAHFENEATIEQIEASDQWSYYQAKGIKGLVLESELALLKEMGKPINEKTVAQIEKYKDEQKEIESEAKAKQVLSKQHIEHHETLSYAVTLFQVTIALTAIAVLARQPKFLIVSGVLAAAGLYYFVSGVFF